MLVSPLYFSRMNENNIIVIPEEVIMSKIYLIRNEKVMLDRDLAELYGVETKYLKRQVKRNILRFPEDFMFQLTEQEFKDWRSQLGIKWDYVMLRTHLLKMVLLSYQQF
jgi:hypothetical protein